MNLRALEHNHKAKTPVKRTTGNNPHKSWKPPKGKTSMYESERITIDTYTIKCRACNAKSPALAWSQCRKWRREHDKKYSKE
jgi:hypothetical protein